MNTKQIEEVIKEYMADAHRARDRERIKKAHEAMGQLVRASESTQPNLEDLVSRIHKALDGGEPCYCGDVSNEGGCPACDTSIAGQKAFRELLKQVGLDEDGNPLGITPSDAVSWRHGEPL